MIEIPPPKKNVEVHRSSFTILSSGWLCGNEFHHFVILMDPSALKEDTLPPKLYPKCNPSSGSLDP